MSSKEKKQEHIFKQRHKKLQDVMFDLQLDYELRDSQNQALEWSDTALMSGKKFLILEMPTGVGKSIYSQYLIQYYINNINAKAKTDILTNTKMLQTQYIKEFKYMNNLWGKSNYQCTEWESDCNKGSVCSKQNKTKCESCPHQNALEKWIDGNISVTNFHIHGLYSIFVKPIMEQRAADLLIVDEAHLLEETVNGFVSFSLSPDRWRRFFKTEILSELESELYPLMETDQVAKFISDKLISELDSSTFKLNSSLKSASDKKKRDDILSTINDILSYIQTLKKFLTEYRKNTTDWVLDKKVEKGKTTIFVQPLWTREIMRESIWANYKHVVLMSATIIDTDMFCYTNGIDPEQVAFLKLSSPFPIKNRPIYYYPISKMSYKNKLYAWELYKPVLDKILKKYEGKKGIIHSGNYELQEWMKLYYKNNDRLIFATPNTRQESIEEHEQRVDDSIIVSPSMMHGVDLKDDMSRFQVILKMPFPSLASKINKQRSELNKDWYGWKTVADIIQSYGRSIRSEDDFADTIILDACFIDVLTSNRKMFPQYFIEAIKTVK